MSAGHPMASPTETPALAGDNSTLIAAANSTLIAATNSTQAAWPLLQFMVDHHGLFLVEIQLILSSLGIIYVGAHGALRRPPSAAPAKHTGSGKRKKEPDQFTEGFQASDAILFPLMAGTVLVGLYYLIKWLQNPEILNKIFRGYLSLASLASMGLLFADTLQLLTSVIFPSIWTDGRGHAFVVDSLRRCQWRFGPSGESSSQARDEERKTPLPGGLAVPALLRNRLPNLWVLRRLLKEEWTVSIAAHGFGKENFGVTLNGVLGVLMAACLTTVYYLTQASALNNLMGLGLCYGAFRVMSCTSFAIGSLVLIGLFVYDIVMVFYTPYMIAVATTIDAPIKLVFEAPGRSSLLGLGDIVIPGIFICMSLRFDLWRCYKNQIKKIPTELQTETKDEGSNSTTTTSDSKTREVKTPFIDPQGRWGDRLWTSSWRNPSSRAGLPSGLAVPNFPKPYFYSSVAGYAAGLLITLCMLLIFKRGQPALLYLVPGVLIATWAAGWFRGELQDMWEYTEDGSLDTKDVVVEVDSTGRVVKEIDPKDDKTLQQGKDEMAIKVISRDVDQKSAGEAENNTAAKQADATSMNSDGHDVFLFSIHAPGDEAGDEEVYLGPLGLEPLSLEH